MNWGFCHLQTCTQEDWSSLEENLQTLLFEGIAKIRIADFFDIVNEYPDSSEAVLDLTECLKICDLQAHLIYSFKAACRARLLIPGNLLRLTEAMWPISRWVVPLGICGMEVGMENSLKLSHPYFGLTAFFSLLAEQMYSVFSTWLLSHWICQITFDMKFRPSPLIFGRCILRQTCFRNEK